MLTDTYSTTPVFPLTDPVLADSPEGRPGREEESPDVCPWHPQPPRGRRGDAGLAEDATGNLSPAQQ